MLFFQSPTYKFMEVRKAAFLISGALVLVSIISLMLHGGPRYSVDFRGGTFMEVRFEDKSDPEKALNINIGTVRQVFDDFGLGTLVLRYVVAQYGAGATAG